MNIKIRSYRYRIMLDRKIRRIIFIVWYEYWLIRSMYSCVPVITDHVIVWQNSADDLLDDKMVRRLIEKSRKTRLPQYRWMARWWRENNTLKRVREHS